MSGLGVVHLLYKVLRDLPVWYRLYTHSLSALFLSDFGEPYKSVQELYENAIYCTLYSTALRTSVRGLGVIHLVFKVQRALPVFCSLYTLSLIELFESDFGKPYKSVQELYENAFCCRLFDMAY